MEKLLASGKPREALDYLAAHQRKDFAPARGLPPKPFESSVFRELPACFAVVQATDADWVRQFLMERLNETMVHFQPRWGKSEGATQDEKVIMQSIAWREFAQGDHQKLLEGLQRIPEGRVWLATNSAFQRAMERGGEQPAEVSSSPQPKGSSTN